MLRQLEAYHRHVDSPAKHKCILELKNAGPAKMYGYVICIDSKRKPLVVVIREFNEYLVLMGDATAI